MGLSNERGMAKGVEMSREGQGDSKGIDWRLLFSMGVTAGWLVLGVIYISKVVGWADFAMQTAPSLGSFLEGAFAPLAFLWLVVGFFLQQQQLSDNTRTIREQLIEMRRSAEQSEVQARAIAADELHSRQDTFLRVADRVDQQLAMIGGWLITSYLAGGDRFVEIWRRAHQGEVTAFSMEAIRMTFSGEVTSAELFFGSEIRAGHSRRFLEVFDRLVAAAERCDRDGMIADAIRDGAHGRMYRLISESDPESQPS
jgi:hypothetical protein